MQTTSRGTKYSVQLQAVTVCQCRWHLSYMASQAAASSLRAAVFPACIHCLLQEKIKNLCALPGVLRAANTTQQIADLRLRLGAGPRQAGPRQAKSQAVQKYDKVGHSRRSNDVSRIVLAALKRFAHGRGNVWPSMLEALDGSQSIA